MSVIGIILMVLFILLFFLGWWNAKETVKGIKRILNEFDCMRTDMELCKQYLLKVDACEDSAKEMKEKIEQFQAEFDDIKKKYEQMLEEQTIVAKEEAITQKQFQEGLNNLLSYSSQGEKKEKKVK